MEIYLKPYGLDKPIRHKSMGHNETCPICVPPLNERANKKRARQENKTLEKEQISNETTND